MGACREVPRWINSSATQRREGFDLHKRNSSPSYRERQLHGDTRNSTLERKSILQSNGEFTCSIETFFFNHSVFHSTTLNQRGGGKFMISPTLSRFPSSSSFILIWRRDLCAPEHTRRQVTARLVLRSVFSHCCTSALFHDSSHRNVGP